MRLYYVLFGILLILSFTDITLAAPVLVQKKRQVLVNVVHISKVVRTVLGKRGYEDLAKFKNLADDYLETWGKSVSWPDEHALGASSGSAPPLPDHGPINGVKAPAPNPASSPTHPEPLMDPLNPSSTAQSMPVVQGSESDYEWLYGSDGKPLVPIPSPTWTEFVPGRGMTGETMPQPNLNSNPRPSTGPEVDHQVEYVQQPNPGSSPDSDSNWYRLTGLLPPKKRPTLASSKELGQAHEDQMMPAQLPDPGPPKDSNPDRYHTIKLLPLKKRPILPSSKESVVHAQQLNLGPPTEFGSGHELTGAHLSQPNPGKWPLTGPDIDYEYWMNMARPLRPRPVLPKEFGQVRENQVDHVPLPNVAPSTVPNFDRNYGTNLEDQPSSKSQKLSATERGTVGRPG